MHPAAARDEPDALSGWVAAAYGLLIRGREPLAGLSRGAATPAGNLPEFELIAVERLDEDGWGDAEVISSTADGLRIERHPVLGHRMSGRGIGRALIEPGARRGLIERRAGSEWPHARWILSQVLPFTASLRGRELLHAGSVVLGGEALALVGASGAGKSTLVCALLERGARFLADDVTALEPRAGEIVAHPGPGILALEQPRRVEPEGPARLGALCLLGAGPEPLVEELPEADPAALLAAAYDRVSRSTERLERHLSLMARVARNVRPVRVIRSPHGDADELASRLVQLVKYG